MAYAALTLVGNVAACAVAIVLARYFRRHGIGIWLAIVGGVATIEVWAGVTLLLLPRNGSVDTADVSFPYAKAMCMAGPCVPEVMIVPALIGLVGTLFGLIVAIRVDHRFTQARTGAVAGVAAGVTIASLGSFLIFVSYVIPMSQVKYWFAYQLTKMWYAIVGAPG